MSTSPSRRRTSVLAAVLVAVALTASACGGDDAKATDKPSQTTSTSATPTPSPTPTPTEEPLSPFEDRPQVQALRAYFVALGQAVNARDEDLSSLAELATQSGLDATRSAVQGDLDNGYTWPGPEPFTPVAVRSKGKSATVSTCLLSTGWSVDPKTGKTVAGKNKRKVASVLMEMKKAQGTWKVDGVVFGTGDCESVEVEEVRW